MGRNLGGSAGEDLRELGAIALAQRIRAATGGQFVLQLMNVREPI